MNLITTVMQIVAPVCILAGIGFTAVVSETPGALGGFGANHALRQSLVFLNMPTLQQPEVYLGNVGTMFDDVGVLTDEATRKFLGSFMQSFAAWIDLHVPMSTAPGV